MGQTLGALTIKRLCAGGTTGNYSFMANKRNQRRGYESGYALAGHIAACHGGLVDDKCLACNEIQRKQAACGQ